MTDHTAAERIVIAMKKFGETPLQVQEYLLTEITTALAEARREGKREARTRTGCCFASVGQPLSCLSERSNGIQPNDPLLS